MGEKEIELNYNNFEFLLIHMIHHHKKHLRNIVGKMFNSIVFERFV